MSTEILRRGDDLTPAVSQSQADGAGVDVTCVNGCGVPMQPLDRDGIAYRCSACDEVTVDRRKIDVVERAATTTMDRALFELISLRTLIVGVTMTGSHIDARVVLTSITEAIGALTAAPAVAFANTVHTAAIGYAVRICALRADSLFTESKNPVAGNEAAKCAFAVQRIRERASLKEPFVERSIEFPEAAHA